MLVRRVLISLLVMTIATLSGCLIMLNPPTNPMTSRVDQDLCGVWLEVGASNSYLFVGSEGKEDGGKASGIPPGLMSYSSVRYIPFKKKQEAKSFEFTTFKAGEFNYAVLYTRAGSLPATVGTRDAYAAWQNDDNRNCVLVHYKVDGNTLSVSEADADGESKWTKMGKLKEVKAGIADEKSLAPLLSDPAFVKEVMSKTSRYVRATKE